MARKKPDPEAVFPYGLNQRGYRFVTEYLLTENAGRAAIAAGCPPAGAYTQGCRMLKEVQIAKALRAEQERYRKKYEVTADRVVEEIAKMAFGNIEDISTRSGPKGEDLVIDFSRASRSDLAMIGEITVDQYVDGAAGDNPKVVKKTKVKLANKAQALDMICRKLGLYKEMGGLSDMNFTFEIVEKVKDDPVSTGDGDDASET